MLVEGGRGLEAETTVGKGQQSIGSYTPTLEFSGVREHYCGAVAEDWTGPYIVSAHSNLILTSETPTETTIILDLGYGYC